MNQHEYKIWRAVTKYDLLHDDTLTVTEDNVEELIDEKEIEITKILPNYFKDKNLEQDVLIMKLQWNSIVISALTEDFNRWESGEDMLYCGMAQYLAHTKLHARLYMDEVKSDSRGHFYYPLKTYDENSIFITELQRVWLC